MTISWTIRPDEAWGGLVEARVTQIESEIVRFAEALTDEIAAYMRAEARWEDRTGDARAGLYADVIHVAQQSVTILMSHGPTIWYSHYLEAVRGGFYGVLPDTVDHYMPVIFREVQRIVRGESPGRAFRVQSGG